MRENITSILFGTTTSIVAVVQNGKLLEVIACGFLGGAMGYAGKMFFQFITSKIKTLLASKKAKKSRIIMLNQNQENQ